jgi:hypothetical protein
MTGQHRTSRKSLEKSLTSGESSILWSSRLEGLSAADQQLASLLAGAGKQRRSARKMALEGLLNGDRGPFLVLTGVDTILRHGHELNKSEYGALYSALGHIDEITPSLEIVDEHQQFIQRLMCEGELPLLLSLVLSHLKGQTTRFKTAAAVLREGLEAGTDTDGMLHATLTAQADEWLAPMVRSAHWALAFKKPWLTGRDTGRLADTLRTCATLLIPTGLVARPPDDSRVVDSRAADVIEHGIRAVGIRRSSSYSSLVHACAQGKRRRSRPGKRSQQFQTSNQSDWAESAILRSGLQLDSDLCVVNWDQPESSIHMAVLGTPLLSGCWSSEVSVNGERIGPIEGWTCSCWFCDDEAAFVELEADPSESVHVVRHVMLSMQDRMAVVCESVTTPFADNEVRLKNCLPLAANPLAVTNSITREIALHSDCVSTRVVPGWLEDDKVHHATGVCEKVDNILVSEAEGQGGAVAPRVLDWHPERQALDADWNRLTVTEGRTVLSAQQAAGFRVRIGKLQMLIYRSLRAGDLPRAVLGLHTMNETVYGRIRKSGEVAPMVLVLVEGE